MGQIYRPNDSQLGARVTGRPVRLIPLVLVLVAGLALAQNSPTLSSWTHTVSHAEGSAADGGQPTSSLDGVNVENAKGYRVVLSAGNAADAGTTAFLGAVGAAYCWAYMPVYSTGVSGSSVTRRWMRCAGSTEDGTSPWAASPLDVAAVNGRRDVVSYDFEIPVGAGRIDYVPRGISTDGGVSVTATIEVKR